MTVTSNSLKFNKATAVELNYAPYIKVLLNAKTRQIAIQPCSEKDPNAIKFSNEESKQTYAISIKVPAIQVEFRRMLPFEDDNGGKLSYTLNGTLYPDEQVVIYDIGDVKPETEKKRRVVITGLGTVNPTGNTVAESWAAIKDGRCAVEPITAFDTADFKVKLAAEVKNFDPAERIDKREARKMARFTQFAVAAALSLIHI